MTGELDDSGASMRNPARATMRDSLSARTYLSAWPTAQGLFHARPRVRQVARQLDVALQTILLCDRLRREHDESPVWLRTGNVGTLLIIHRDDIASILYGAPEPFTADTAVKHAGMSQYQPGAVSLCRGAQWRRVRDLIDTVLSEAADDPAHAATARTMARNVVDTHHEWDFRTWLELHRRLARHVVLGERAAGDQAVTDLLASMTASANRVSGRPDPSIPAFNVMIESYLRDPQPGSVAANLVELETPQAPAAPQLAHLLTKLGDTLALNTFHALQLLAARPPTTTGPIYMTAALQEAARLWPTSGVLTRESTHDTRWGEELVPAGTQFLIVNTFGHRDRRRVDYADDFLPTEWLDGGSAQSEMLFNGFGHGPQDCPGEELALSCGSAILAAVTEAVEIEPPSGVLRDDGRVAYSSQALAPIRRR
ncbi:cytochrome P450 [Stackebrandtia soli]|uniref:cytochrome P450 n=1 Tax=Stackebrandtia soli TaxID=1892856 RepID=UPI0039EAF448